MGGWANPLQTLSQGPLLTFHVDPDPELDNMHVYSLLIISTRVELGESLLDLLWGEVLSNEEELLLAMEGNELKLS